MAAKIESRVLLAQDEIDNIMAIREQRIRSCLTQRACSLIPADHLASQCALKVNHFKENELAEFFNQIMKINNGIIESKWNLYYAKDLACIPLVREEKEQVDTESDRCKVMAQQALDIFIKEFMEGKATIKQLPIPDGPRIFPIKSFSMAPNPAQKSDVRMQLQVAHANKAVDRFQKLCKNLEDYNAIIHSVGSLHQQLQFCRFVQEESPNQVLHDLSINEYNVLKAKFRLHVSNQALGVADEARDAVLQQLDGEPPQVSVAEKPRGQKKKRGNKKKSVALAEVAPKIIPNQAKQVVQARPSQESMACVVRLNQFDNRKGCVPHTRLERWAGISLSSPENLARIRGFIDFDLKNNPKKLYQRCSLDDLRQHKQNHDIPIHTILREKALVNRYSFHHLYQNDKNEQRDTRVFYADKIILDENGQRVQESGLIHAAVDDEGVVYHCMFKKTKSVNLDEITRQYADPEPSEPAEGKDDGGEAAPFQFMGNYHIEIDPKDDAIVIKIGQDQDPHQVIYRIHPL